MATIKVGISVSSKKNLIKACQEAAQEVKNKIQTPKLLMVFFTSRHSPKNYQAGLDEITRVFPENPPLIGGSVDGFFAEDKSYGVLPKKQGSV